ncbi:6-hydroxynicotinate reductase [Roseovarius sp. LXJ103]|uniref:6-hydroxynicotinate reductase n=1 Tax=Roseovarius carneus TaxID=2853164 RepID=UPI000D6147EA|nr:6-hydroxynicotinate reductase [Roseovarius carneus]MBZ8117032.1 6-hydroxynicotinate reductase [Roseovarius carneus]PWE37116.1 6-hydroxynicotinate reductase [Pelagicola sp. LXJ1103]
MTDKAHVKSEKIRCDACPVLCYIADGKSGACDRYGNHAGELVRLDPLTIISNSIESGAKAVPFMKGNSGNDWDGDLVQSNRPFITAVGAGTTYPDYKPAPFIVSQKVDDTDMVTIVTEGIFSYCGVKVKIDTDRFIGHERDIVLCQGEPVGHVMTSEYGSKMLSLGGVEHLTGGTKKEGRVTCDTLLKLCNGEAVELTVEGGACVVVQAGKAPIVNGQAEKLMRVGCGSAAIGMFASQWVQHVDEVIVVDDHITGVLSEHQAGKMLNVPPSGIKIRGRRSTPGRYFQVAQPGTGWGGTDVEDPLTILKPADKNVAWQGLRLLMVSTTGEQYAYFQLDADLEPQPVPLTEALQFSVDRIAENCEPSICSVLFMGGAGGSLRAGVTENPVKLTNSVKDALTHVSCGGANAYVWPGGGITVMADVLDMPSNSFGYVPTPALVAPIEFTMRLSDYVALGGHADHVRPIEDVILGSVRRVGRIDPEADPTAKHNYRWKKGS